MSHNLCAIIGKAPVNENKVKEYSLALAYENDFAILILDDSSMSYWSDKLSKSSKSESNRIFHASETAFFFAAEIGLEEYAMIQTDYWGGKGEQFGAFYKNGKRINKEEKDINLILRRLGVERTDDKDQFEVLNLGEYRGSRDYYTDQHNDADAAPNMIAGRIPAH